MTKQKRLVNREISWLHFNERVLQEAMDENNPVIERLKFLGIFSNNRDEFFRVRVATIKRVIQIDKKKNKVRSTPTSKILSDILIIVEDQEKKFNYTFDQILKELDKQGIVYVDENSLNDEQGKYIEQLFKASIIPNLFPIMMRNLENSDALQDNAIYLAVHLQDSRGIKDDDYALVRVPSNIITRFIKLPSNDSNNYVIMLDDVMRYSMGEIFAPFGFDTYHSYTIKFTRDAELDIDNDISKSFIEQMSDSIKKRKKGAPVRFVYDKDIPEAFLNRLLRKLNITNSDNLRGGGKYHNFKDFMSFPKIGSSKLVYSKTKPLSHPAFKNGKSILKIIREQDVLLHFPYQSFQYIVDLLREASIDPKVREGLLKAGGWKSTVEKGEQQLLR